MDEELLSHRSESPGSDSQVQLKLLQEQKVSLEKKVITLEKDLQSQKIGKDGMETVAKLLQETRQDLVLSEKKNKVFEIGIRNLQNRLEQNGLNSSIELEEQEMFIPGPSKQVMDNLMRENARLRLFSNSNVDFDEIHSLKLKIQDLEDTVDRLQRENAELTETLSERTSEASSRPAGNRIEQVNCAQRMQIDKMEEQIRRLEQERREQSDEMAHLQQQLNIIQATPTLVSDMNVDECAEIQRLGAENERLISESKKLMEMNQRWKSYNDQREAYVRRLMGELEASKASAISADTQKELHALLTASRQQLEKTLSEKSQLAVDVSRLEEELRTLQEAYSGQGEELRRVRQAMEQLEAQDLPDKQHVEALQIQVQLCTEDFEKEKKDREKTQERLTRVEGEKQDLIKEINRLRQSFQQYASRASTVRPTYQSMNIPSQHQARPNPDHFRFMDHYGAEPEVRLNARGFSPRIDALSSDVTDSPGHVEEDGQVSRSGTGRGKPVSGATSPQYRTIAEEISMLQCPKCKKEYKANQHNELLEHIDICC